MLFSRPITYDLSDCRVAHGRIYDTEVYDGDEWVPHGRLAVMRDMITHDGNHIHTVDYHGPNHALLIRGKAGDPTFRARLNLTECGNAFVGTMSTGGGKPQALRGTALEQVYRTQRHLKSDPAAPFLPWEDFTIKSEWVSGELKITYLLGSENVSDRTRVTKVDRAKGETWLEMVAQFQPPFRQNAFSIVLVSGSQTFTGTLTDDDGNDYDWRGATAPELPEPRAAVFRAAHESRPSAFAEATPSTTMSLQDLDNISSIQVVTDDKGKQFTVDFAQTTCGGYFNKCLVNALDQKWIDGIYGHAYYLPPGVQQVFSDSTQYFKDYAVLGTGQMLYDNLGTNPQYRDLIKRIQPQTMQTVWQDMGKSQTAGLAYQEASNALYIQGYRDGVPQMQAYLQDDPEKWALDYFNWLSDDANLLTWQIQVASKEFDNVKSRMYEWYVKLQVLAPDKDYGQRFMTIAYAALLGVTYSKSRWSDDLKPYLQALIENAIAGKVDPTIMDEVQQQAAKENQELMSTLVTTADQIALLVDGIAAAMSAYQLNKPLQQLAQDPQAQALIGQQLQGAQYEAWSDLTTKGKVGGLLSMMFYGATAGYLIYTIAQDSKSPQTPKQITTEVNLGVLAMAILVKGIEKMMSLGVGRFLENFSLGGHGGAFRTFAGDLATWFKEGGKIVPEGPVGKAFVAIFGENSAEFMTRRIGPAMAVCGLVLSAFMLYDAIQSGDIRNVVFEALNAFVGLLTVALIGFELMSFAWAGPAGLALAVVGIIITLVQFIWNLIDPPQPAPDPITEFVDGPMVAKGFATAG
ncbi:hypothetical protein [Streptomyces cyanogenus]|uniref:Uncharacterized protein n=1 Tax=Streptomyces cyanogenus TaxID=80860 RepID=A0ABX7THY3_STRCY|nr:hypothetical protein [Streptomyces cyanogenus]QTD96115.1 hypothetical protein S1361_02090 [Streptomyces cyanogenus]